MNNHETLTLDLGERSYDIHVGSGLLDRADELVPLDLGGRSVFILSDENVFMPHAQKLQKAIEDKASRIEMKILPPGEQSKSHEALQSVLDWMLDLKVERSSVLIAVGGGVIGDLGGFAASIVMRGIPYVQVPTTLLSMVDSSVGGKTGINTSQGKNLVGSFYQPISVIADTDTLQTLPKRELLAGYAECVKHAAIFDEDLFTWFEEYHEKLLALDPQIMRENIVRNCKIKASVVQADEWEAGKRALLNLGHTFGHALELEAGYDGTLIHGEAVAIGMVLAFRLSEKMGLCLAGEADRIKMHLEKAGLPTRIPFSTRADIIVDAMKRDKKSSKGTITFVLAKKIGEAVLSKEVDLEDVKAIITEAID